MSQKIHTVCPRDCYDTCSLIALKDGEDIVSIVGDPGHEITQGFLCPRGNKDAQRAFQNRVLFPWIRKEKKPGRAFERAIWDQAIDRIVRELTQVIDRHGPHSVLLLDYAGNNGLLAGVFPNRLWNAIGASKTDHSVCSKSGHVGISLHYGSSHGLQPESLLFRKTIVYWGFNAAVSAVHIHALSLRARRAGARIVCIDPRRSETAKQSDVWISPRPGTDVVLVYGIARALIQNALLDLDFLHRYTIGFERFAQEAMAFTPEKVEKITGVNDETVERLARWYAESKPAVTLIGIGFQKSKEGADMTRAVSLLSAMTGQHRGFFYSNGQGYPVDLSYLSGSGLGERTSPVVSQVELGEYVQSGAFKFVYIYGANPAVTLPDQNALRKGLLRKDVYTVVHEVHWTDTCDFADVVLPAQSYLEKEDIALPWTHGWLQKSERVIAPLGESRHEIDVMDCLARGMNRNEPWLHEDPWKAVKKSLLHALAESDMERLFRGERVRMAYKALDEYPTSSGKIHFSSDDGSVPLPVFEIEPEEDGQFVLLGSSMREYTHTQFQEIYGPIPTIFVMNPQDCEDMGIREGQVVSLKNGLGAMEGKVKISDDVPRKTIWTPKESVGLCGRPLNGLVSGKPQRIGGGSTFNSTRVEVVVGASPQIEA